ncbi:MAG: cysteine--tRNA ligase [Gorillibacterium sp.]|nr:cysteine--tRNA ligase [Gorillibacterium sp.]
MTLKIYNTLTRMKEDFKSIEPGKVTMYACGPTVYDYIHIGNSRMVIFFDVVRRYLEYVGYEVSFVVNFTDVDDKLIRKANEMGSSVQELADKYIQAYHEDTKGLRVGKALNPRVTENIPEIVAFVSGLIHKDVAYESGGDVYFRTESFEKYGQISHKNLEDLQHGIRVEVDGRKKSPQDFVLWKKAKSGEINWSSPWGKGRPGWHIECSAMAAKYLGETIDIHGGGEDLQFPHHECEAAQSESLHGKPLAHYWMHNAFLNIENEKMSKSMGNGLTIRQLLKENRGEWLRFVILSTHYRNPLNYNGESLHQAEAGVERLNNSFANLRYRLQTLEQVNAAQETGNLPDLGQNEAAEVKQAVEQALAHFNRSMSEDFNTPDAITAMFDLAAAANRYMQVDKAAADSLKALIAAFEQMDAVLQLLYTEEAESVDEEVDRLIEERQEARRTKNWSRADEIREFLINLGIIVEDTPQGIRWRRK